MSFLKSFGVEVAISLCIFSLIIFMNASRTAVYDRICHDTSKQMGLDVKCHNLTGAPEAFHDKIRSENGRYNTWDTIGQTVTPRYFVFSSFFLDMATYYLVWRMDGPRKSWAPPLAPTKSASACDHNGRPIHEGSPCVVSRVYQPS